MATDIATPHELIDHFYDAVALNDSVLQFWYPSRSLSLSPFTSLGGELGARCMS